MRVHVPPHETDGGFTLVELLVVVTILAILIILMASMVNQTNEFWRQSRSKAEQFRDARLAFESITRRLSQATLNTYLDVVNSSNQPRTGANSGTFVPNRYIRQSELRFISGNAASVINNSSDATPHPTDAVFFQAPLGFTNTASYSNLENLLNTWGYFIDYGSDLTPRPSFVTSPVSIRFRLMELMVPTESMALYNYTSGLDSNNNSKNSYYISNPPLPNASSFSPPAGVTPGTGLTGREWFTNSLYPSSGSPPVHVLAANIVALILLPKLSPDDDPTGVALAPQYSYDSTSTNANANVNPWNQLPPVLQVTLVAIDEDSAVRMGNGGATNLLSKIGNLFSNATKFAADLTAPPNGSLNSLETYLVQQRIHYRIFTSSISIKSAKWSQAQQN